MSSITGEIDQYGFERPSDFDYESYEAFMSDYMAVLARRAAKWDNLMKKHNLHHSRKVKRYVRKGVPSQSRGEVWLLVSNAQQRLDEFPEKYNELHSGVLNGQIVDIIERDIQRTYPENMHFQNHSNLLGVLRNILIAFAHYKTDIGYCQGLNYIAGMLLLISKEEEQVFWLLVEIVERVPDFYSTEMMGVRVECRVLMELLSLRHPDLYGHFMEHGIDLNLTTSKWFICLFVDVLPVETALRILDCLFYEGSKVLLRVALTLIVLNKEKFLASKDFNSICVAFKEITKDSKALDCHKFMQDCFRIPGYFPMSKIKELRHQCQRKIQDEDAKIRK
eukprot:gene11101-12272_t